MAVSGISAASAGVSAPSQPTLSSIGHHKHGGHHSHSLTDIDAQGSSVASTPSSTGKIGSKLDLTA
jgi:hypothetical protein